MTQNSGTWIGSRWNRSSWQPRPTSRHGDSCTFASTAATFTATSPSPPNNTRSFSTPNPRAVISSATSAINSRTNGSLLVNPFSPRSRRYPPDAYERSEADRSSAAGKTVAPSRPPRRDRTRRLSPTPSVGPSPPNTNCASWRRPMPPPPNPAPSAPCCAARAFTPRTSSPGVASGSPASSKA